METRVQIGTGKTKSNEVGLEGRATNEEVSTLDTDAVADLHAKRHVFP